MHDGVLWGIGVVCGVASIAAFGARLARSRRQRSERAQLEPVWAAARELARSRGHGEVREAHFLAALLFDSMVAGNLAAQGVDVDTLKSLLDEELGAVTDYRTSVAARVTVSAALAERLDRAPGARRSVVALLDAIVEDPPEAIAKMIRTARETKADDRNGAALAAVMLELTTADAREPVLDWMVRCFALSRAEATFVIETAARNGKAVVCTASRAEALRGLQLAKAAAAERGVRCPFVIVGHEASVARTQQKVSIESATEQALGRAAKAAMSAGHAKVELAHLALALLEDPTVSAPLSASSVDVLALRAALERALPKATEGPAGAPIASPSLERAVQRAVRLVFARGAKELAPKDVFCTLYDDDDRALHEAFDSVNLGRSDLLGAFVPPLVPDDAPPGEIDPTRDDVVLHDDPFTTMEQVHALLVEVFGHDAERAKQLVVSVHKRGTGVAGTYPRPEASAQMERARSWARAVGAPLRLTIRPARMS